MFANRSRSRLVTVSRTVSGFVMCLALLTVVFDTNGQKPGGRYEPPPTPPPGPSVPRTSKPKPTPLKLADLIITAPLGCRIWLNDREVELQNSIKPISLDGQKVTTTYVTETGTVTIKGLKPAPYKLIVRKQDYQEFTKELSLVAEVENVLTVFLLPTTGRLTVKPSAEGANVEVFKVENNMSLGKYSDYLDNLEIAPGNYRINTSKEGYRTAVREVTVNPGESVFLEPVIELLPKPPPRPNKRPALPVVPATFTIDTDGKNAIVRISGSTGDVSTRQGTITVQFGGSDHGVVGSLNGMPCLVEFVKLENVAEGAVVEAPGPSNSWARIVVRVRSKDKKRPLSFAVNWRSLSPGN